jgi:hypothetical protein
MQVTRYRNSREQTFEQSSKFQHPSSREIPITKPQPGRATRGWMLKFGASLDVGAWNLELCSTSMQIGSDALNFTVP